MTRNPGGPLVEASLRLVVPLRRELGGAQRLSSPEGRPKAAVRAGAKRANERCVGVSGHASSLLLLAVLSCKQQTPLPSPEPQDAEQLSRWDDVVRSLRADRVEGTEIREEQIPVLQLRSAKRPTILAFWATYCPPCIEEMPMFSALHDEGRAVVGVSLDTDNMKDVAAVLRKAKPTYPQVVLREASMKKVGLILENGLPATVILDQTGNVRALVTGKADRARIEAALSLAR